MSRKKISVALVAITFGAISTMGVIEMRATSQIADAAAISSTTVAIANASVALIKSASTTSTSKSTTTPIKIGAWLPYWQGQAGAEDIAIHLMSYDEISPFSYEIDSDGLIMDDLQIGSGSWDSYFLALRDGGVKIIPTIAYFDGDGIYTLLSKASTRQDAEDTITQLTTGRDFDGIDIDFEGMTSSTRPYYSLFIKGLATRLHAKKKTLTCTVVPRTPLDSLYVNVPKNVTYAEDYTVLNKYCDEVRLMAYDQEGADIKLDASKGSDGTLYAPVADPDWVEKVVTYALQYISPKKIMIGVPTYGYEYQVSWANGKTTYQRVRSFDYFDALNRAEAEGVTTTRNNANELTFTFASSTHVNISPYSSLTFTESSTQPAVLTNINPNASTTFFVSFPDAQSEMDKVALAQKYGLRGIIFFKANGQIDPAIWDLLP